MAIDPRELMLGNYVEFMEYGSIFQITEIYEKSVRGFYRNKETWRDADEFSPIPITEQWLKDFGFDKDNDGWYRTVDLPCLEILFHDNGICVVYNSVTNNNAETVHGLQNLYYALTGHELKLKEG